MTTSIVEEDKKDNAVIYDNLTQVYNRYKIMERLKYFLSKKVQFTMMFIDIDDFNEVNEKLSRVDGDEILKIFAYMLKKSLSGVDIIGRWGGEEFIVVLKNTDINQSKIVAERMQKTLNTPIYKNQTITASISITENVKDETVLSLLKRSELKMANAKRNGKNQIIV
ncbi:MAG: GGDEF domain-containing protein [Campylobacterota bacterium]|nr:GGDEF domain-containing protein [Campylobacterota bacterium]